MSPPLDPGMPLVRSPPSTETCGRRQSLVRPQLSNAGRGPPAERNAHLQPHRAVQHLGTSPQAKCDRRLHTTPPRPRVVNPAAARYVLLATGDGTFQPAVNSDNRSNPLSAAVGDFDKRKMESRDRHFRRSDRDAGQRRRAVSLRPPALPCPTVSSRSSRSGRLQRRRERWTRVNVEPFNPGPITGPGWVSWGGYYG